MSDQFKPQRQATRPGREILPDFQYACPFLGFLGDSETRARQASSAHRCFADHARPKPISDGHQQAFCLSPTYDECSILQQEVADAPKARERRATPHIAANAALAAIERSTPAQASRQPLGTFVVVLAAVVFAFAVGLAGLVVVRAGWVSGDDAKPAAAPISATADRTTNAGAPAVSGATVANTTTPITSPTVAPSPTPAAPLASATSTSVPTPVPTPTQAPTPTVAPTAIPTRQTTYVALNGDSYIGIARKLGIDVDDLLRASRRTVNTPLYPGDILQLP